MVRTRWVIPIYTSVRATLNRWQAAIRNPIRYLLRSIFSISLSFLIFNLRLSLNGWRFMINLGIFRVIFRGGGKKKSKGKGKRSGGGEKGSSGKEKRGERTAEKIAKAISGLGEKRENILRSTREERAER